MRMIKQSETSSLEGCVDDLAAVLHCLRGMHAVGPAQAAWLSLDLSMSQMKALMVVLHHSGSTSRVLAERLGIGASAVTPLVDKLVQQKLVRREDDPSDRRVIWIKPTAKASALHERLLLAS